MEIGTRRERASSVAALAFMVGCIAEAPAEGPPSYAPDVVVQVFEQPVAIAEDEAGLTLSGFRTDGSSREDETLWVPPNVEEGVLLGLSGCPPIRVIEESVSGHPRVVGGTIALRRLGGRSYWTAGSDQGLEEWVELDGGTLDRPAAAWRVPGRSLREVDARGGVHVLDDDGEPIAYVSAPYAVRQDGTRAAARLGVDDERIVLYVDSPGQPVLVDPLWVATGVLSRSRRLFTPGYGMEQVPDGALIVGGYDGVTLASTERYDELTGIWSASGEMLESRSEHSTTRLPSGEILVVGGTNGARRVPLATAELYDPATGTWTAAGTLSVPRAGHTATLLASGQVLVVGGDSDSTAEIYEPLTRTWTTTGAPTAARRFTHRAAPLGSGAIVVGGFDPPARETAEIYDPTSGTWQFTAPLPAGAAPTSITALPSGEVLVAGRLSLLYDVDADAWSAVGGVGAPTTVNHTATLLPSGGVLTAGGNATVISSATSIFTPLGSWVRGPSLLTPRIGHAATVLPSGRVLVAGTLLTSELFVDDTICGNGVRGSAEGCDDGNREDGDCCSALCQLEASSTVCRASTGECDVAETCTGTTAGCPFDGSPLDGTPCGGAPSGPCDAPDTCVGFGVTARCRENFQTGGTACTEPVCIDGIVYLASLCTGVSAECPAPVSFSCAPHGCDGAGCAVRCDDELLCTEGYLCIDGSCVRAADEGDRCATDAQCRSGHCTDGVCCDSECSGQCEACDVPASEGECVAVEGPPHADRPACVSDGSACGGACDGRAHEACTYPDTTTPCAPPVCASGVSTTSRRCDGGGTCADGVEQDCEPYACDGVRCGDHCTTSVECAPSYVCVGAACERVDSSVEFDGSSEHLDGGDDGLDRRDASGGGLSGGAGCAASRSSRGGSAWWTLFFVAVLIRSRRMHFGGLRSSSAP